MALANYGDLKTAVAKYLQRSDLTTYIPDFVTLCQAKVARVLRTLDIQTTRSSTLSTETLTLPSDFLELVTLHLTYSGNVVYPDYVTPERMKQIKTTTPTVTGIPLAYTIHLGKTEYYPGPQAGTTFTEVMAYYQRITAFSADGDVNWLLTNYPDIYLYGSLSEAEAFVKDDARIQIWKSLYQEAVASLELMDDRKRVKRPAEVDLGLPGQRGSGNIETGF